MMKSTCVWEREREKIFITAKDTSIDARICRDGKIKIDMRNSSNTDIFQANWVNNNEFIPQSFFNSEQDGEKKSTWQHARRDMYKWRDKYMLCGNVRVHVRFCVCYKRRW